jgi:hypothetical protein
MDVWELNARECIRDLVARYNANGDAGRFNAVRELFASDAVMELGDGRIYTGLDEIMTIFTGTQERVRDTREPSEPIYVRHSTASHQIDVVDATHATGRAYFNVVTPIGLDHWGRYVDQYGALDGRWHFTHRRVTVEGYSPASIFI